METKPKSQAALERAIARYEMKLAKAPNPTRRRYASSMLRMARDALERSRAGEPHVENVDDGVVDLLKDEYAEL